MNGLMRIKNNLIIDSDNIYYAAILAYVLSFNIQYSYFHNAWAQQGSIMLIILKLMRYFAYLCCVLRLFLKKLPGPYLVLSGILMTIAFIASFTGPNKSPIFYMLLLIGSFNTDFKKLVKIFLAVQLCTFCLYVLGSSIGVFNNEYIIDFGRKRYFLGYGWVNRASYCWLFICLELLYLKDLRFNSLETIIGCAITFFIFNRTDTVFSALMTIGIIGLGFINHFVKCHEIKLDKQLICTCIVVTFVVFVIVGGILSMVYSPENNTFYRLNRMVNGRFELGKIAIEQYGLHLGGNKLEWVGSSTLLFGLSQSKKYFYVDNSFLQTALEYGLLFAGSILLMYTTAIEKSSRIEKLKLSVIMLILGVLFLFEPYAIDFGFNPFILYAFSHREPANIVWRL